MAKRGSRSRKNRPRKRGRGSKSKSEIGRSFGTCMVCGQPLGIEGGMADTDMCGPCCTGEAETLSEFGETW